MHFYAPTSPCTGLPATPFMSFLVWVIVILLLIRPFHIARGVFVIPFGHTVQASLCLYSYISLLLVLKENQSFQSQKGNVMRGRAF